MLGILCFLFYSCSHLIKQIGIVISFILNYIFKSYRKIEARKRNKTAVYFMFLHIIPQSLDCISSVLLNICVYTIYGAQKIIKLETRKSHNLLICLRKFFHSTSFFLILKQISCYIYIFLLTQKIFLYLPFFQTLF